MASRSMSPEYLPVPYQSLEAGRAELVLHLRGYLLNDGSCSVLLDHGRYVVVTEASTQEAQSSYAHWPAVPAACPMRQSLMESHG
jgi:hypothetical protein